MFAKHILFKIIIFSFFIYSYSSLTGMNVNQIGIEELSKSFFDGFPEFACGTNHFPVDQEIEGLSQPFVSYEQLGGLLERFNLQAISEKERGGVKSESDFVQKLEVLDGDEVYITGDLHGSAHSLFRNFLRLKSIGVLNNDFSLNETASGGNNYFLFTGDYADRGRYGVEVWYLILRLKLENWDNVFLCRGNHELKYMAQEFGFFDEIKRKYVDAADLFKSFVRAFNNLPSAVFVGDGEDFIQVSHGGIPLDGSGNVITKFYNKFLNDTSKMFSSINEDYSYYLLWGDFSTQNQDKLPSPRGGNLRVVSVESAKEGLKETRVRNVFRGHQHCSRAVSMKPWKLVKDEGDYLKHGETVSVSSEFVYTFMSCPEGVGFLNIYDGFGLLKIKSSYKDWTLTCFEYPVDKGSRRLVAALVSKALKGKIWICPKGERRHFKFVTHLGDGTFNWYVPELELESDSSDESSYVADFNRRVQKEFDEMCKSKTL